jgi:pimeloyl-ACP methyl ester carboxylesterase
VWGREDAIVPVECGELFQQALPNATLKVIEHCGHTSQPEAAGVFAVARVPLRLR